MKDLTKIADKGDYLVSDNNRLLFIEWTDRDKIFFAFNNDKGLQKIQEKEFCSAIGGYQFEKIQNQLGRPIHDFSSTVGPNGDRYFCFYQTDVIYGFDKDGNKKFEWTPEIGQGHCIYDIKFQSPNSMWLAFPTGQTVTKVSLDTKEEEYQIGEYTYDHIYEPLSYPESLFITDRHLFIPNMGNNKLYRLDLTTYKLDLIETFPDRLWEYIQIGEDEYVHLDKGVYKKEKITATNN